MATILEKSNRRSLIVFLVLFSIVLLMVGYFNVYVSLKEGSTWENRFEKIEITNVDAKRTERLVITLNYKNSGGSDTNVTNIFINNKPLSDYTTFIEVYDAAGNSIKNLLREKGL